MLNNAKKQTIFKSHDNNEIYIKRPDYTLVLSEYGEIWIEDNNNPNDNNIVKLSDKEIKFVLNFLKGILND